MPILAWLSRRHEQLLQVRQTIKEILLAFNHSISYIWVKPPLCMNINQYIPCTSPSLPRALTHQLQLKGRQTTRDSDIFTRLRRDATMACITLNLIGIYKSWHQFTSWDGIWGGNYDDININMDKTQHSTGGKEHINWEGEGHQVLLLNAMCMVLYWLGRTITRHCEERKETRLEVDMLETPSIGHNWL